MHRSPSTTSDIPYPSSTTSQHFRLQQTIITIGMARLARPTFARPLGTAYNRRAVVARHNEQQTTERNGVMWACLALVLAEILRYLPISARGMYAKPLMDDSHRRFYDAAVMGILSIVATIVLCIAHPALEQLEENIDVEVSVPAC